MFQRVALTKGVIHFGVSNKLSPYYIGSFEILERIGDVACWFAIPFALSLVHSVFHVSMLRKYIANLDHVI